MLDGKHFKLKSPFASLAKQSLTAVHSKEPNVVTLHESTRKGPSWGHCFRFVWYARTAVQPGLPERSRIKKGLGAEKSCVIPVTLRRWVCLDRCSQKSSQRRTSRPRCPLPGNLYTCTDPTAARNKNKTRRQEFASHCHAFCLSSGPWEGPASFVAISPFLFSVYFIWRPK